MINSEASANIMFCLHIGTAFHFFFRIYETVFFIFYSNCNTLMINSEASANIMFCLHIVTAFHFFFRKYETVVVFIVTV